MVGILKIIAFFTIILQILTITQPSNQVKLDHDKNIKVIQSESKKKDINVLKKQKQKNQEIYDFVTQVSDSEQQQKTKEQLENEKEQNINNYILLNSKNDEIIEDISDQDVEIIKKISQQQQFQEVQKQQQQSQKEQDSEEDYSEDEPENQNINKNANNKQVNDHKQIQNIKKEGKDLLKKQNDNQNENDNKYEIINQQDVNFMNETRIINLKDTSSQIIQSNGEIYFKHQNDQNNTVMVNLRDIKEIKIDEGELDINKMTDEQLKTSEQKYLSTEFQPFVWTPVVAYNQFPNKRGGSTMNVLGDFLIIFGGCHLDLDCFNDLLFYNIGTKEWTRPKLLGVAPSPRSGHTATLVGSSLYVFGGSSSQGLHNDLHVLDFETRNWKQIQYEGVLPTPRTNHGALLDDNGRIVFFGGYTQDGYSNEVYFLNLVSHKWEKPQINGKPPLPREQFGFVYVRENVIYIFGGYALGKARNDIYELNLQQMLWIRLDSRGNKPTPRQGFGFILHNEIIYLVGGCDYGQNQCFDDIFSLEVDSLQWSSIKLQHSAVVDTEGMGIAKVGSNIFSFGGCHLMKDCSNDLLAINLTEPCNCQNKGVCRNDRCVCKPGFTGENCEVRLQCSNKCLARGVCGNNGKCQCYPGYTGASCELYIPCPNNCTDITQGICEVNGQCKCNNNYQGNQCDIYTLPEKEKKDEEQENDNDGEQLKDIRDVDGEYLNIREIINNMTDEKAIIKNELKQKLEDRMRDGEDLAHLQQEEIYNIKCLNDCNLNGICNHKSGFCICNDGFGGPDCGENLQERLEAEKQIKQAKIDGENEQNNNKQEEENKDIQISKDQQIKEDQDNQQQKKEINQENSNEQNQQEEQNIEQVKDGEQNLIKIKKSEDKNQNQILQNGILNDNISDLIRQGFEQSVEQKDLLNQKINNSYIRFSNSQKEFQEVSVDNISDPDDCLNGCSENGVCINFICYCKQGLMGEDCSAQKLSDLKTGEKPIYLVYYGVIWFLFGLLIGYIILKQFKTKQDSKDFENLEQNSESSVNITDTEQGSVSQQQIQQNQSHVNQSQLNNISNINNENNNFNNNDQILSNEQSFDNQNNQQLNNNNLLKDNENSETESEEEDNDENQKPGFFSKILGIFSNKNKEQQQQYNENSQSDDDEDQDQENNNNNYNNFNSQNSSQDDNSQDNYNEEDNLNETFKTANEDFR